jgi:hypothetical protein
MSSLAFTHLYAARKGGYLSGDSSDRDAIAKALKTPIPEVMAQDFGGGFQQF